MRFLMMKRQVAKLVPEIRDGRISLPQESDLAQLVDWNAVQHHSV